MRAPIEPTMDWRFVAVALAWDDMTEEEKQELLEVAMISTQIFIIGGAEAGANMQASAN